MCSIRSCWGAVEDQSHWRVTIALLFWGAVWGASGCAAIPITGALKIICEPRESMKPWADWLGE